MNRKSDVCIIGGGASGLVAAASLDSNIRVCLLEKNTVLGRKVLATGGGRCNLTNSACPGKNATLDFFASKGLETTMDREGRYFPYSEYAPDVVGILTSSLGPNVEIRTEFEVCSVEAGSYDRFKIQGEGVNDMLFADYLIIATGGKAAPRFGTTGDGYRFARRIGHSITRLRPILTGVECRSQAGGLEELKGIRAKARVTLLKDGKEARNEMGLPLQERGEVQFTGYGVSGICIYNFTPYIIAEPDEDPAEAVKRYSIMVDLAPDLNEFKLRDRTSAFGLLAGKLAARIDRESAGEPPATLIKAWKLDVTGLRGWKEAQCTGGGVCLDEINMETMESKLLDRLYFAGEIIDAQGPCGGYNLQNAWETGMKAAQAINSKILGRKTY